MTAVVPLVVGGVLLVELRRTAVVRHRCGPSSQRRDVTWRDAGLNRLARLVVSLAVAAAGVVAGLPALLAAPCALLAFDAVQRRLLRERSRRAAEEALPVLLEGLGRHLRSGGSIRSGLQAAASRPGSDPVAAPLASALERGEALPDAVHRWLQDSVGELRSRALVAAALTMGAEVGGAQATALDRVAQSLRERRSLAAEVQALAAQARASAAVLAVAPLAFGVLGAALEPEAAAFLLGEPAGLACLAAGCALQAAGWWWMRKLIEAAP